MLESKAPVSWLVVSQAVAAGNLCFFNSLLQALSYTPKLPRALYQDFPNVLEPPAPEQDEPLSRFQPGQKKAAPTANQGKPSLQGTDSPNAKAVAENSEAANLEMNPGPAPAAAAAQTIQPSPSERAGLPGVGSSTISKFSLTILKL